MSRISNEKNRVVNYMGGTSYTINPLDTLKMVSASSIFGEPQYYRNGINDGKYFAYSPSSCFSSYDIFGKSFSGKTTSKIMEELIDKSLSFNFEGTIKWALTLRTEYNMRLNPQVIMVRAAMHPDREEFTKEKPELFSSIEKKVMSRADEPASQFAYYLHANFNKKNCIPNILKRSWNNKLSSLSRYEMAKYKNSGVGMIDTIRVCHATSPVINELMKTGSIDVSDDTKTWEALRSEGKSWKEIVEIIRIPHMALLRNLRGIFTEIDDKAIFDKLAKQLKSGVPSGKQFPFRYMTARNEILKAKEETLHFKQDLLDLLEQCIDISTENMPKLKGKTICLSDNSGSAHGAINSEFGSVKIADIDNLSSVITAKNSDEGYVGVFGDDLDIIPISKEKGTLIQTEDVNNKGRNIGMSTENGIWLFFKNAIDNREHWDNIIIYSDMQAGHGELYGKHAEDYSEYVFGLNFIDVIKLIEKYREINPRVNVYCVQTAGYNNVLVPEYGYRTNILYGWTGKEALFIDKMNKMWDELDRVWNELEPEKEA